MKFEASSKCGFKQDTRTGFAPAATCRAFIIAATTAVTIAAVVIAPFSRQFTTVFAEEPAAATSAMTDPSAVDWGARFDQARAAKDPNALILILDMAPIPEWNDILDKAAQELVEQCDVPDIDKPESRGSFLYLPAVPVEGATDGRVAITQTATVNAGTMVLSPIPGSLPRETAGVSISLKPPMPGVSVELFELTLVKSGDGERIVTSVLIGIGPGVGEGTLELTGAITAKNRGNTSLAEIPLDVKLDVVRAAPTLDTIGLWYRNALAQRFIAATVKTGEKKTDWLSELLGGDTSETDRKNRGPNSRKYDLLAYNYGEFLRQVARSPQYASPSDYDKQVNVEFADVSIPEEGAEPDGEGENGATGTDTSTGETGGINLMTLLQMHSATDDPMIIRAATDCLMYLERFELRRAQYMASREGRPIPESVEPGYWWQDASGTGYTEDASSNVNRPPRYSS